MNFWERYLRQGNVKWKGWASSPFSEIEDEISYFGLFFFFFFLSFKSRVESLVYLSLKIKEPSTCGHELERDLVEGEEGIYSLLQLISSMSQAIHYIVMTIAKKYMFSMKFMSFHGPYIIQIQTIVNISIPRITNM